jgi:hypothetical protein
MQFLRGALRRPLCAAHAHARLATTEPRLVVTHGSYCEQLIPVLTKVRELNHADAIHTIVPGRMYNSAGKSSWFKLKVTNATVNGFKALARNGSTAQEVFFVTKLSRKELKQALRTAVEVVDGRPMYPPAAAGSGARPSGGSRQPSKNSITHFNSTYKEGEGGAEDGSGWREWEPGRGGGGSAPYYEDDR